MICVIALISGLVAANMLGQVNDMPPMDDFIDFYNTGQGW